jgi:hypothetical protein
MTAEIIQAIGSYIVTPLCVVIGIYAIFKS